MKLILSTILVVGVFFLVVGCSGEQEKPKTSNPPAEEEINNLKNGRFFFNFNSDPCTNAIFTFLNMSDAKCSLQCFIQGGLQQGGYCDTNNVCQCNQIA